jgi:hypothetical protein
MRNAIYNVAWKGNSPYATTLFCDVRPAFTQCTGRPFGMFVHFSTLYPNLDALGSTSLFGRVADNDFAFYANSWSFVRWAIDRYATTEAGFLRGLTQSTTLTGTANITAQTGQPADAMEGNWSLALFLDENAATSSNRDLVIPTWNTRDIFAGMNTDFATTYPKAFPLVPRAVAMSDFIIDNSGIHGGSFAMYDLSGTTASGQTIGIVGLGGNGTVSPALRIAIARVQ